MATLYSHYLTRQRRTRQTGDLSMNRSVKHPHSLEAYVLVKGNGDRNISKIPSKSESKKCHRKIKIKPNEVRGDQNSKRTNVFNFFHDQCMQTSQIFLGAI